MGTNYYLQEQKPCATCGHEPPKRHIGKSSAGWLFLLRVYPEEGINTYTDWYERFTRPNVVIYNEYGNRTSLETIVATITNRKGNLLGTPAEPDVTYEYASGEFD